MAAPGNQHATTAAAKNWRQVVTSLYNDALKRTYTVPPVHFNKVSYGRNTVPGTGQPALILHPPTGPPPPPPPPSLNRQKKKAVKAKQSVLWTPDSHTHVKPFRVQDSDAHDDFCQRQVLANLQALGDDRQEVMFILSQLKFGNYLNQPSYAAAAAQLPRPVNLAQRYHDGEFDFLLLHRQHGVLIGELKSVGRSQAAANLSQAPTDAAVAKRVEKAVQQLDKSETVVRHVLSDVAPGLSVRKTLFLPFVSSLQLRRVLDNNPLLLQAVCNSLNAADAAEATQLCCCSEQLSRPESYWEVTSSVLHELSTWWQHRMACSVDTTLTDDLYLDIVARFVGPATAVEVHCNIPPRVEVRTVGEAVSELGRRLACLVLTLQQLDLLHRSPHKVCVTGPPGTGKTLMLVLQGLAWLLQGKPVHLVSTTLASRAVSVMMEHQLQATARADPTAANNIGSLHHHHYDFRDHPEDVDKAIKDLTTTAAAQGNELYMLMDEAEFNPIFDHGPRTQRLVQELTSRVTDLHLWTADIGHTHVPRELQTEVLSVPVRCAPVVQRQVQSLLNVFLGQVNDYNDGGIASPGDGLGVTRLQHSGKDHHGEWPVDCLQCGENLAAELRRLGVGKRGRIVPNGAAPLNFSDVFVLTRNTTVQDDVKDDAGNVTSPASGLVRALHAGGFPLCVLGGGLIWRSNRATHIDRNVADMAVSRTDRITVADWRLVHGLERKVVVLLAGKRLDEAQQLDQMIDAFDRLAAMSRCTTQLILIDLPR